MQLKNRTAVVTGSSSGIGRAIAIEFARQGANVLIHGREPSQRLEEVEKSISQLGVKVSCLYADFSNPTDWKAFVDDAWNQAQGFDIWVNNAGGDVLTGDRQEDSLEKKLDYLVNVDVKATLMLSREAGAMMAQRHLESSTGDFSIINIGWDQAAHGMAGESGELFAATKGAIMAMSKSLAQSLAPNVRVNCIAPGWIQTQWGHQASDTWQQRAVGDSLMRRWGQPEDVAAAAVYLASESASFVTGQVLPVNGGFRYSR